MVRPSKLLSNVHERAPYTTSLGIGPDSDSVGRHLETERRKATRFVGAVRGGLTGWLSSTRATMNARILLVQKLPGLGAIQSTDPSGLNDGGIEIAKIDAHSVIGSIYWFPVRNAAAVGTPNKPEALVSPDVTGQISLAGKNFHLAWIVVAPEPTVASTD